MFGDGIPDGVVLQTGGISDCDGDALLHQFLEAEDLHGLEHLLGLELGGADVPAELSGRRSTSMSVGASEVRFRKAKQARLDPLSREGVSLNILLIIFVFRI